MIEKGSKPEDELKKYWFCIHCRVLLRPVRGRPGGGKFVISQKRPEVGIKGAISSKKIYPEDAERTQWIWPSGAVIPCTAYIHRNPRLRTLFPLGIYHPLNVEKMRTAFVPPNPKELDIAMVISASLDLLGT